MIRGRKFAYQMVFAEDNQFTKVVLKDLARFCRAHDSTFDKDPRRHAALEGRREVFLRIQEYLNLTESQIYDLHRVKEITTEVKK
jgi:hypothetical protein